MESVHIRNYDMYWDIAADIHFPPNFDKSRKYPAIISAHPIASCKEQTSGNVYAPALANEGFVVIAFDASFQGASGGEPRSIEDPVQRVEDFRHVTDYLVTLPYVDEDRCPGNMRRRRLLHQCCYDRATHQSRRHGDGCELWPTDARQFHQP